MVWQFVDALKRVITSNRVEDDDSADRLSRRYTVGLLIMFFILVSSSQYVGSPITCWSPGHFSGAMVSYTNNICWIANTYYVPTDESLPNPTEPRKYMINYYQWVPFILALMALFFYLPFIFWRLMSKSSGLDAKSVMKIVYSMDAASNESRDKVMKNTVRLIDRAIDYHRDYYDMSLFGRIRRQVNRCCLPPNRSGYYISVLYIFIKLLYIGNVMLQFFILNSFMIPGFGLFGVQVIQDLIKGKSFWESPRFPRVTMCDFVIRTLGENNHRNTIQCTLPINLFNEKIFIFIWFWLLLVAFISVYSLFSWIFTFTIRSRLSFIRRYLKLNDRLGYETRSKDDKLLRAFVFDYLKPDGVFLLRIVKKNTNDIVVGELVCALWDSFKRFGYKRMVHLNDEEDKEAEVFNITSKGQNDE
jgi:hypothetical protein